MTDRNRTIREEATQPLVVCQAGYMATVHAGADEVSDIAFDAEGVTLRGWLYRPTSARTPAPVVVMAHGYNCLKEFYLDKYAAEIAAAGHCVVAYDHRNFGDSDGEPRQELDPWTQVRDYRHAITYAQTLDGVDPHRVGIWGSSYAGGHVLVVAAIDRRVKCVVAQVPTISGWESTVRRTPPQGLPDQRLAFDADRLERFRGGPPKMVPMVVEPSESALVSHASSDAWAFFTGQLSPPEDQWRFAKWRNEITLRSLEFYSEYEPGSFVERIAPHPAIDGGRRLGRGVPDRPDVGRIQSGQGAQAARALPGWTFLGLHRSVRACFQRRCSMVHRALASGRPWPLSRRSENSLPEVTQYLSLTTKRWGNGGSSARRDCSPLQRHQAE